MVGVPTTPAPVQGEPALPDLLVLLTPREREVAALIAAQHTNRMIATELAISERTVDTHVGRILAKLGFTSRAQITAWVEEQQLRKV